MNPDVLASYTQNIGQGKENYSRINAVYSGPLHPALHRNGAWPAPPGVTSERRLEGLCIHFLICFSLWRFLYSIGSAERAPDAGPCHLFM